MCAHNFAPTHAPTMPATSTALHSLQRAMASTPRRKGSMRLDEARCIGSMPTTDSGVRSLLPFPFLGGTPPPLRMRSPPSPQDNTAVGDDEEHRGSGDSSMAMTLVAVHDMFLELACSSGVGPTRAKTLSAILKDAGVTNLKVLRALRARARGTICDLRVMHARNFDLSYLHDSRP